MTRYIYAFLIIFSTGCGYQLGRGSQLATYQTISIPYICGDRTGEMTNALIKEMSRSGAFAYCNRSADLCLKVNIVDLFEQNIGYQQGPDDDDGYDDQDGRCRTGNSVIPNETRLIVIAEVTVIESCTGCVKLGPGRIRASYDFDHDYYFSPDGINQTSLGQLTNMESAREAVIRPLSAVLAQKIVDYVVYSW
ncbi:putative uncharacterized protein [Waddlia chondrophila 2032/99]|uniref:Lipoprotein n=1 Tax=Waddlia chondrophila 2032/99 TaxID=765953 RepID=F8LB63_9BACT|nr:putative uncharacterized protein [Waddlia chondrophila 2032/99]